MSVNHLEFIQQPVTTTVGNTFNTIMVNVEDTLGNVVTSDNSTVTLTDSLGLTGVTSVAAVNGVARFTGLSSTAVGDQQIVAQASGITSATSNWFSTVVGPIAQLVVTQQPHGAVAGQSIGNVAVQAKDALGNVVTGSPLNGTAPDSADSGNAVWTANASIIADGSEMNVGINEDASLPFVPASGHVYVFSASLNPADGNTSNWLGMGFLNTSTPAGTYGRFHLANTPEGWLLERDNRQTQSFYESTGLNGPTAAHPSGYDRYDITLDTTESAWTIAFAQDGTTFNSGTYSSNPVINAIGLGTLMVGGSFRDVSLTEDGVAIYSDQFSAGSTGVTLSSSGGATINGQTAAQMVNGQATFTSLSMNQAGDYTLSASVGSQTSATSNSITITPATASKLAIAQQPTDAIAGQAIGAMVVDIEDAFGNLVTSNISALTLHSTTTVNGTLTATANNGIATFNGLSINQAGSFALSVSDGSLTAASSNSISISAAAAAQLAIAQQPHDAAAAQSIGTVVADVQDIYGNVVTTDNSMVSVSILAGTPLNGATSVSAVNGVATFSDLSINPAGAYTLSATDGALNSVNANSVNVAVGAATHLAVTVQPTDGIIGQMLNMVQVEVEDAGGNMVTTDNSTVTVSSDTPLNGSTTISAVNGAASFANLSIAHVGTHQLSFIAPNLTAANSSAFAISTTLVTGVSTIGDGGSITGFVVSFNGPLDPTTAQDIRGYRILRQYTVKKKRSFWQGLFGESAKTRTTSSAYSIASAVYDAQADTVRLQLTSPITARKGVQLVQVRGTGAHAVFNANGNAIDGDSNGHAGGKFSYRF